MLFVIMLTGQMYTSVGPELRVSFDNNEECIAVAAKMREADKTVATAFCEYTVEDKDGKKTTVIK